MTRPPTNSQAGAAGSGCTGPLADLQELRKDRAFTLASSLSPRGCNVWMVATAVAKAALTGRLGVLENGQTPSGQPSRRRQLGAVRQGRGLQGVV